MGHTSYDAVASLYDRYWGREFARVAKAGFDNHLLPLLPNGSAVLDLCCGTGLVLAHLHHLGFAAYGVDESREMLAIACRNAPGAKVCEADMATFHMDRRFDAVVSFYNSLNHARSLEHLQSTLFNVAKHLKSGGFFLFDYVLPEAFERAWEWCEQFNENDDCWTFTYTFEKSTGHATCLINEKDEIRQISVHPIQIRTALRTAGLVVIADELIAGASPSGARHLILASSLH